MRSSTRPDRARVSRHTYTALTTCPRWRKPVGAGANRDMMPRMIQGKLRLIVPTLLLAATTTGLRGQSKPAGAEWTTYGGDLASTRYSPLDQITKDNFNKLEIAWRFKTDSMGPRPEFNFQVTPLMVDGVVYTTAGTRRAVVALDAVTGEMKWMHSENEGKRGESAPRLLSGRGLAYWPGSAGQPARIVYVTPGYQMVALDAKTGVPATGFGKNGIVDLKMDDDQPVDPITGEIGLHATPIIAKDAIVVGPAHLEGSAPKSKTHEEGLIGGSDAKPGKRLWIFHTIPSPGEFGNNTWEKDSWAYTGNAGVWAQMTIDEELGMVYLPVELPTGDYYGGNRPGNGLFGESVVALDLKTGVRKWHFQLVHHGIWDMDIPCAPILADITVDGKKIKALAQITKQGWVYVFDRTNGQPVWPIEERPVEKGTVPGEWYAPTQPFVTRPPAFDRQGVSPDDVIDFTPELHAEALALLQHYRIGPLFTPPTIRGDGPDGIRGTLQLPGSVGGADWQGGAFDPETGMLYVPSITGPFTADIIKGDPKTSNLRYVSGTRAWTAGPQGLPLLKPPYGRITAIDLNTGTQAWMVPNGEGPRNHPLLKPLNLPWLGNPGRAAPLLTKTLLFVGEGDPIMASLGSRLRPEMNPAFVPGAGGKKFRAYDKAD